MEQARIKSQFKQALQSWGQSLAIYREIGDRQGIAKSLGNLGLAYYYLADYRKGIDYQQQSLKINKKMGNRSGIANSLNNLGVAYNELKNYKNAENNLRQAITIWEDIRKLLRNQDTNKITIFEQQTRTYLLLQEVLVAKNNPILKMMVS